jgi:hypothetical protein
MMGRGDLWNRLTGHDKAERAASREAGNDLTSLMADRTAVGQE